MALSVPYACELLFPAKVRYPPFAELYVVEFSPSGYELTESSQTVDDTLKALPGQFAIKPDVWNAAFAGKGDPIVTKIETSNAKMVPRATHARSL
jgi:hypothetical protein